MAWKTKMQTEEKNYDIKEADVKEETVLKNVFIHLNAY